MPRYISLSEAAARIDGCLTAFTQVHQKPSCLRQDLIRALLVVHRNGFESGLLERIRATPKRYYSKQEVAVFRADGTNWPGMFRNALSYFERGNFGDRAIADARRMGELSGLSNKQIGAAIAKAMGKARRVK